MMATQDRADRSPLDPEPIPRAATQLSARTSRRSFLSALGWALKRPPLGLAVMCQWVWFAGEMCDGGGDFGDGGGGVNAGDSSTCLAVAGEFPRDGGAVVPFDPSQGGVP
jgi:hypothetical protein